MWCIMGDFNDMLYRSYKKGSHPRQESLLRGFRKALDECLLSEVELQGGSYAWEKSRGSEN